MSSRIWDRMWNPFSSYARIEKALAAEERRSAEELHERTINRRKYHSQILEEQKELADELRKEMRKNHFSSLFQEIPAKDDN